MKKAFNVVPIFQILIEYIPFSSQPWNMNGVKQLAINIWGYFLIDFIKCVPDVNNLTALIINEMRQGVKYTNILYLVSIIGSIVLLKLCLSSR